MIDFGIDFGTTNTAVVECIRTGHDVSSTPCGEGNQPFPSLVALHPTDPPAFGMEVKKRRHQLKASGYTIISSFKSILGASWKTTVGERIWSAVDVTALFLQYVRQSVEKQCGCPMHEAVISIPVDFSREQRKALREAAQTAGITVRSFVSEPTAAYFYCQESVAGASNVAVFDWGGGTLDVSILSRDGHIYHELAVSGKRLGGNDIDEMIAKHLHAHFMRDANTPKAFDDLSAAERDQIIDRSEDAKKRLSTEDSAMVRLMKYCDKPMIRLNISLTEFEDLISVRVRDAVQVLNQTLDKANISLEQLDAVLMVGGSCEMQPIVRQVEELCGDRVYRPEQVQWAVAGGAALLAGRHPAYQLQRDFGVLLSDGTVYPVFSAGQRIPCQSDELTFGVVEDTTNAVFIFADSDGNELERLLVPVKGFTAEGLRLRAAIDDDMIASAEVCSTYAKQKRTAYINQLPFAYNTEGGKNA